MPSVKTILNPKTIIRARLLLGALLLFAAVLTWGIGLSLSAQSKAVVAGTEHVRSTVVIFKRNSAIGTLFLTALAGWMLFPRLRPRRPVRDWAVILLLALLAGSSTYTLLTYRGSLANASGFDENLAISNVTDLNAGEITSDAGPSNTISAPAPQFNMRPVEPGIPAPREPTERTTPDELSQPLENVSIDDQANRLNDATTSSEETNDAGRNDEE